MRPFYRRVSWGLEQVSWVSTLHSLTWLPLREYLLGLASASLPSLELASTSWGSGLEKVVEPPWKLGNWVGPHLPAGCCQQALGSRSGGPCWLRAAFRAGSWDGWQPLPCPLTRFERTWASGGLRDTRAGWGPSHALGPWGGRESETCREFHSPGVPSHSTRDAGHS